VKYYVPGMESKALFLIVVKLTNIRSPDIVRAMELHIVDGMDVSLAALGAVDESNLKRALVKYNDAMTFIEQVKELTWSGYNASKQKQEKEQEKERRVTVTESKK